MFINYVMTPARLSGILGVPQLYKKRSPGDQIASTNATGVVLVGARMELLWQRDLRVDRSPDNGPQAASRFVCFF
jgi:hypothetical protein